MLQALPIVLSYFTSLTTGVLKFQRSSLHFILTLTPKTTAYIVADLTNDLTLNDKCPKPKRDRVPRHPLVAGTSKLGLKMAPTASTPRRSSRRGVNTRASNLVTEKFTRASSPGLTTEEVFQLIAAGSAISPVSTTDVPTAASTPTRPAPEMAPVRDPHDVDALIRDVHQTLYDIQNITHGFQGPETAEVLVERL